MPSTITAINSFNAGHTALSAQLNTNFDNMRGNRIPLDMSIQSSSNNFYDVGRKDKQFRNIYVNSFVISTEKMRPLTVGDIISYTRNTSPSGYLLCDGSSVSRSTYSDLFTVLTNATNTSPSFGYETTTHFYLPDLRGTFIRGTDQGASNDPDSSSRVASGTNGNTGDTIGSYQTCGSAPPVSTNGLTDTSGSHTHAFFEGNTSGFGNAATLSTPSDFRSDTAVTVGSSNDFSHIHSYSGGDNETRPINLNAFFYIRY